MEFSLPISLTFLGAVASFGTLGFALLNFLRSGMGARIERLEKSEAECQADRLRMIREATVLQSQHQTEQIHYLEEIARLAGGKIGPRGLTGETGPPGARGETGERGESGEPTASGG